MGIKRKQHSAEFKAGVATAALSGEKTLADCCEAGDDCAGSGAVHKPAMHAAGDYAQQLLLPPAAGICRRNSSF